MTMTTTNVEILRQGWLDAASALAPGLDTLPEALERSLEAAVVDERLDEQSLLKMVGEVTADAADSLPTDELYFLTRRLQRAVYEYLLSLDALPEPPPRRDGANGHAAHDTTLIGAEEVAALGRHTHVKADVAATAPDVTTADPPDTGSTAPEVTIAAPEPEFEPDLTPASADEPEPDQAAAEAAADRVEAGLAELDAQLSPEEPSDIAPIAPSEVELEAATATDPGTDPAAALPPEPDAEAAPPDEPPTRPAFTLFRRTGAAAAKALKPAPLSDGSTAVEPVDPATNGSAPHPDVAGEDPEPFVKPKDGFHLSDLADFAVVQRSEPVDEAPADPAPDTFEALDQPSPDDALAHVVPDPPNGATTRGWRLRDDDADQAYELDSDNDPGDQRFETDPEVVEARLEINDRLRRKRCDEAAALLQRLANDVGGRALAELALDAGDRCRALGKGNAALSCYLAASRADPVHETPLLRLADICIDDHDIDLAVSYLERVTRLRRLRNDDKGALKLYRKIVTIAPYRDDILAMLMRAQANGRFEE
jgi:tetratricopeptide (TPR) repeat protein